MLSASRSSRAPQKHLQLLDLGHQLLVVALQGNLFLVCCLEQLLLLLCQLLLQVNLQLLPVRLYLISQPLHQPLLEFRLRQVKLCLQVCELALQLLDLHCLLGVYLFLGSDSSEIPRRAELSRGLVLAEMIGGLVLDWGLSLGFLGWL